MKTLNLIFISLLISITACAKKPESGFRKFYNEYQNYPNSISFKIPAGIASIIIGEEDEEVDAFMDNMDNIHFLVIEKIEKQVLIDLNRCLPSYDYKELMVIKEGTSEVVFLAKEMGNIIDEIIMTAIDDNELVVMCITGEFTIENAKKLAKSIDIEAATHTKNN